MVILLVLIWLFSLILAVNVVTSTSAPFTTLVADRNMLVHFLQRLTGLLAFTLLFFQLVIGSAMPFLRKRLGKWLLSFHQLEGAFAYVLIVLHPMFFILFNYGLTNKLDPFYVFTDFCALCSKQIEYFYTFGRVAFWLVTLAVVAAKLRSSLFLRNSWRKLHSLNYLVFFLVAFHAYFVGTDVSKSPFVFVYFLYVTIAAVLVVARCFRLVKDRKQD
ncbi:MAG: ferric reductase protein [uncultured bacterium]|nr:MAG: ferric reductase protein [uncultured bacterium]